MKKYDYVLVGAGLYSGVIAYLAGQAGKSCLVLERRDHTGGNIYCEEIEGIHVHKYGAHIFHTSNKEVWQFVNSLAEFNRYTNSPIANYKGEIYNMPFNMNTFSKMWGIRTPEEAKTIIEEQRKAVPGEPKNLDEQAIKLVGKDTRVIEHKHFEFGTQKKTVISREYSTDWKEGMEPYYPVNDARNQELYQKYAALAEKEEKVIFGGRLGEYKYYDMDKVIEAALNQWEKMQR